MGRNRKSRGYRARLQKPHKWEYVDGEYDEYRTWDCKNGISVLSFNDNSENICVNNIEYEWILLPTWARRLFDHHSYYYRINKNCRKIKLHERFHILDDYCGEYVNNDYVQIMRFNRKDYINSDRLCKNHSLTMFNDWWRRNCEEYHITQFCVGSDISSIRKYRDKYILPCENLSVALLKMIITTFIPYDVLELIIDHYWCTDASDQFYRFKNDNTIHERHSIILYKHDNSPIQTNRTCNICVCDNIIVRTSPILLHLHYYKLNSYYKYELIPPPNAISYNMTHTCTKISLDNCPSLTSLKIHNGDCNCCVIVSSNARHPLKKLYIQTVYGPVNLPVLQNLKKLTMNLTLLSNSTIYLKSYPMLETLILCSTCSFGGKVCIPHCDRLKKLKLMSVNTSSISHLVSLEEIHLSNTDISLNGLVNLQRVIVYGKKCISDSENPLNLKITKCKQIGVKSFLTK